MRLVLARTLSYTHRLHADPSRVIYFRRGMAIDVPPVDYEYLMSRGLFVDPDREIDFVHPRVLKQAPPGTEVPVIRGGGMGDVLMLTIALRELAAEYPRLHFTYATSRQYLPLLRDCGFLARACAIEDLNGRYPYGLDMRGYSERLGREREYRIDVFSMGLVSRKPSSYIYPLEPREEEEEWGRKLLKSEGIGEGDPVLALAARASVANRTWGFHDLDLLAALAGRAGWRTVLLDGTPTPMGPRMEAAGTVNLTGRLDVSGLMAVLQASTVHVGPDTGTIHLAEALGVRNVAVMTTVDPDARLRHYRFTRALWAGLPCSPCYHQACAYPDPKPCAEAISAEAVWREVEFVASHEPPWALEPAFQIRPVSFPRGRQPLKLVVRAATAEMAAMV